MNSQDCDNGEGTGREAAGEVHAAPTAEEGHITGEGHAAGEGHVAEEMHATERDDRTEETAAAPEDAEPDPVVELQAERDRLKDQHLRLAAEFDNYRKRTEDRLRQRLDRAQADLVSRLLEPLDDLLRVTALEPENKSSVDSIVEGVDLVERKFFRVLGDAGVEVVDPVGDPFDPNTMEAMMRVPAESEEDDETVATVFQRGYTLRGLLIRPARVSVFKCQ